MRGGQIDGAHRFGMARDHAAPALATAKLEKLGEVAAREQDRRAGLAAVARANDRARIRAELDKIKS